ncbi:MAG TPA: hypothetical protein VHT27_05380 [Solirubrobacteraceae bacterium]|nr:hypothetical protein [Solirubrobacteraceae bacterium]
MADVISRLLAMARRRRVLACAAALALLGVMIPAALSGAFAQQGALTGTGESGASRLGVSAAVSADGSTALVGGPNDNSSEGAAWVFVRSGSTWTQQGEKLVPNKAEESAFGVFGWSVALSADGNTALVGAIGDGGKVGAAWVFVRSGSTWSQQGTKLIPHPLEETGAGEFGEGVALSADGNTALIGAGSDNSFQGAAWVFTRSAGAWTQQGTKLTGGEESGTGEFGYSVALSADGSTALMGGPGDNTNKGAAWVFTRSGTTWSPQGAKLTGSGEAGAKTELGYSAALSASGDTALLGGPFDNSEKGAAWAYTRSGSTWSHDGEKLTPTDEVGTSSRFGWSVALGDDGHTALIGGPFDSAPAGAAWQFQPGPTGWQEHAKVLPAEASTGHFGSSVALAADAGTAIVGEPEDGAGVGAAFAFFEAPPAATTGAATALGTDSATLNGTYGLGPAHAGYFEYGTTTAYGKRTSIQAFASSIPCKACAPLPPIPIVAPVSALSPATTYHYRLVSESSGGTTVGADQTFTTLAAPSCLGPLVGCCGPATPRASCCASEPCPAIILTPRITNASQSHRRWRRGSAAASLARRRIPLGTSFTFDLNVPARVRIAFSHRTQGRKLRGRCVKRSHANVHRPACTRSTPAGALLFEGHAGIDHVSFQGRLRGGLGAKGGTLTPGNYTAVISATAGATSNHVTLTFTIVR